MTADQPGACDSGGGGQDEPERARTPTPGPPGRSRWWWPTTTRCGATRSRATSPTPGSACVATAADGPTAVRRTLATRPGVLVLDLNLPGLRGDEVCASVMEAGLSTRVLILSASAEQKDVLEAVKVGATGYLLKSASRESFLAAVRDTAAGRAVFTPGLAGLVLGEFRRMASGAAPARDQEALGLTERETEVLRLVATGMSYKQIAARLFISHRTVQNHVQNTLAKLQLHNRVELARFAIARGLDTPPTPLA